MRKVCIEYCGSSYLLEISTKEYTELEYLHAKSILNNYDEIEDYRSDSFELYCQHLLDNCDCEILDGSY